MRDAEAPVDTLIEHNLITNTSLGIFAAGDYTCISRNRITKGRGTEPTGILVGLPGQSPVGTQILENAVEHFTIGISTRAKDSLVAYNHVCKQLRYGILVENDSNVIEANRVTDTVGFRDSSGLAVLATGNLIIRSVLKGNRPFDLTVQDPTKNDLVENQCIRSSPPNLCNRERGGYPGHQPMQETGCR